MHRLRRTSSGAEQPSGSSTRVAYVVHSYPSISHTFVLREVLGVRAAGARVETFSIHRSPEEQLLSQVDRREAARTEAILPVTAWRLVATHLAALLRSPRAYVSTLAYALAQSPPGARARLWQVFYFAEAILLWDRCRRRDVSQLHAHLANVAADVAWLASHFGNAIGGTGRPGRSSRRDGTPAEQTWRWSFTMHGPTEFGAVERFNLRRKVAAADRIVCISDHCRSQLMALSDPGHWKKMDVVHCGVDLDRYTFHSRGRDGQALHIVSVGRLVPEKGHGVLLRAMARLRSDGVDATLTLVGAGPELSRLTGLARQLRLDGSVVFAGALGQDELPALLARADVFALASFSEGLPVVLMEAMASGVPVVATAIAGIPELIENERNGLLVAPGREDQLADAIRTIATHPALADQLAKEARATVEAQFDARDCSEQVYAVLSKVARG